MTHYIVPLPTLFRATGEVETLNPLSLPWCRVPQPTFIPTVGNSLALTGTSLTAFVPR